MPWGKGKAGSSGTLPSQRKDTTGAADTAPSRQVKKPLGRGCEEAATTTGEAERGGVTVSNPQHPMVFRM